MQGEQMIKKILKYLLVGVFVYVTIIYFEICCIYAVLGEDTWNYLKEVWGWYSILFFI